MNPSELDRAYGLDPGDPDLAVERARALNGLAVVENGILFRYVPAGELLMGSAEGDPDERPVHPVHVDAFWLSETTISWDTFARLLGWNPPPDAVPPEDADAYGDQRDLFELYQASKIRLQYCEDKTLHARDWHAHVPAIPFQGARGTKSATKLFQSPERSGAGVYRYSQKPMIAVSWREAEELCEKISTRSIRYRLPTEAEWEKAARGGLVGRRYAWGDEPPTSDRCDFDRFDEFSIQPCRTHPPNGYGIYAMCGSVWEWTSDAYDALAYAGTASMAQAPGADPSGGIGAPGGSHRAHVLRGGSWADGPDAVTVSFRMSLDVNRRRDGNPGACLVPNVGFRVCRELT